MSDHARRKFLRSSAVRQAHSAVRVWLRLMLMHGERASSQQPCATVPSHKPRRRVRGRRLTARK
jgi:hypothetical protein